ncbi:dehydrogenase reductase SDR member 4 [Aspergillus niger]|uniref:Oxidoreductase n=2 Tax=Aspergillus TaxID=5052 RepID=A0A370PZN6_ASPPH|nr:oxidoreductase [Aspergillus phoenicis ATCC 13157]GLA24176.1 dehydrogenase reductase SDR member 4 [Aspergillus niger]GLA48199.1 dehydrogenase reductase SDR member 4 [Aspergillus niger]
MGQGRLQDKIAIVTGGGFGFGEGIVHKFILEGANVVIVDLDQENGKRVQCALPAGRAVFVQGDVSSDSDWEKVREVALENFKKIDIVINNAGIVHAVQPSLETSETMLDRMYKVNVKSIYHSAKTIAPLFQAQGGGVFVNISSMSSIRPRPKYAWYSATKGAVSAATKSLAAEFAKDHIRLNTVCPVAGETGMMPLILGGEDTPENRSIVLSTIPMGRFATPADVANATAFLASDEASFITGVELPVDGGRSL